MDQSLLIPEAQRANGKISIIKVKGCLDATTAEELERAIDSVLRNKCHNIVVDLYEVEYISSMGWGVFISRLKQVRILNGDIKLARMRENIYEVYKVLEFHWFINTYDSISAAVAAFAECDYLMEEVY